MNDQMLESYLQNLDRNLNQINVSEKAEIITEMRSHVLESLEQDPTTNMKTVLDRLGEPEQVANRYLIERGLPLRKKSKGSVVKWLSIGFMGTFALSLLFFCILAWKFTPFIEVDEQKGKVQLLGGLININGNMSESSSFKFEYSDDDYEVQKKGVESIDVTTTKLLDFNLKNGNIKFSQSEGNSFSYKCSYQGEMNISKLNEKLLVQFEDGISAHCKFYIPADIDVDIDIKNGNVEVYEIKNNVNLVGKNVNVKYVPEHNSWYRYNLSVKNGSIAKFNNSEDLNAYKIKINIKNGRIGK